MEVLTANEKPFTTHEMIDGIPITRVLSLGQLFSVPVCPTFPFWLKSIQADLIHFQMPFPLAEFSEILSKKRAKIVVSWHSDIVSQVVQRKLFEPFLYRFLDRVDKILVATPNHITSSLYLPTYKSKCEIVPFGIDFQRFSSLSSTNEIDRIRKGAEILILFVGRLVTYKGVEYLIRAMVNVKGRLLIVGDGPLKQPIIKLAESLGLQDRITIISNVSNKELPYYYKACDIFVLPSIANSEAFGIVQLEAMACAKPVITTNLTTGVTYVNQNEVTGLHVAVKDSHSLARAINELALHPEKRELYGKNGQQQVYRLYNNDTIWQKVFNVYKSVLNKN
jgi:rhamnosyl/mannosyltransferase